MIGSRPDDHMKPEPSMTTRGRAAAKGTKEEWVRPPSLSASYVRQKREEAEAPIIARQPADDTAARRRPR